MIELESILYYVVYVGREEVFWAKSIEKDRSSTGYIRLGLFEDAIRLILKTLVLYRFKEVR